MYIELWLGNLRQRDHLEDLSIDGKVMLRRIFKNWVGGMDSSDLDQNRDKWRSVVKALRQPFFLENAKNFLTSRGPVSF